MKNLLIVLIACLASACVSAGSYSALQRRNAELEQRDLQRRQENARRDGYRPPGAPGMPSADPHGPSVQGGGMVGQGQGGAMWARRQHGPYMGAVGEYPRQMTQGRKIKVTNLVCDDGARGFVCEDRDQNGEPDFNTWLAFQIDGFPVLCDSGAVHPVMNVTMLMPNQSCFVEFGAAKTVKLKVLFFRNNGNPWTVADVDATPYKTITKVYKVSNGVMRLDVEENTSSAF